MATEKRLIDANAFKGKLIRELNKTGKYTAYECGLDDAISYLDEQPTVDAVEVVRCKDCKYAMDMMPIENSGGYMMGECTLRKEDDIVFTAWGDDFCSYGERKEQ